MQHPFADTRDQAGLLGQRDERLRRDVAPQRVVPADQRLGADDPTLGQIELRLIVQPELALARIASRMSASSARRSSSLLVHLGREEAVGRPAFLLGAIQRDIGLLQQDSRIGIRQHDVGRVPHRDADADTDGDLSCRPGRTSAPARRSGAVPAARCRASCRAPTCTMANSSPPSRASVSVSRTQARSLAGHVDQQPVAGGVAQRVVHLLEAVEIEVEHGQRRALAPRPVPAPARRRSRNSARFGSPVSVSCVARCVDRASARCSSRSGIERSTAKATAPSEPASIATTAVLSSSGRSERWISTRPTTAPESYTGLDRRHDRPRRLRRPARPPIRPVRDMTIAALGLRAADRAWRAGRGCGHSRTSRAPGCCWQVCEIVAAASLASAAISACRVA